MNSVVRQLDMVAYIGYRRWRQRHWWWLFNR